MPLRELLKGSLDKLAGIFTHACARNEYSDDIKSFHMLKKRLARYALTV